MWKTVITILCAIGTVLAQYSPQTVGLPETSTFRNQMSNSRSNFGMRRFSCPDGFVRMKRDCFYLSKGIANWQEAHFHCKDRKSTLATLTKRGMNRKLRKYLIQLRLRPFEQWIGAKYDRSKMKWTWGVSGEIISYNGFGKLKSVNQKTEQWQCAAINPRRNYHWSPRDCIKEMPYICQTRARHIGRGGKRKHGVGARRKQRMRAESRGNETLPENSIDRNEVMTSKSRRRPWRMPRRSHPMWGNGVKSGAEARSRTRWAPGAELSDRLQRVQPKGNKEPEQWVSAPVKAAMSAKNVIDSPSKETSRESPVRPESKPKALAAEPEKTEFQFPISNIFETEVLLKD
ncbi:uncharacterized protein LOC124416516 [Diprion similis]|uniref:uncharacterized protein LOC124416516 n=1 Tax=Diprion similis TaxID=362088 RepID=UPI001EF7AF2B|nr:uncharacterized protein LOC124416516 [Diprion similis]